MAQVEVDRMRQDHLVENVSSDSGDASTNGRKERKRKNPAPERLLHSAEDDVQPLMYMECEDADQYSDEDQESWNNKKQEDTVLNATVTGVARFDRELYMDSDSSLDKDSKTSAPPPEKKPRKPRSRSTGKPMGRPRKNAHPPRITVGRDGKLRKSYYIPTGRPRGRPRTKHLNSTGAPPPTAVAVPTVAGDTSLTALGVDRLDNNGTPTQSPAKSSAFVMRIKDPLGSLPKRTGRPRASESGGTPKPRGRPRTKPPKDPNERRARGRPKAIPPEVKALKEEIERLTQKAEEQENMISRLTDIIQHSGLEVPWDIQSRHTNQEENPHKRFVYLNSDGSIRDNEEDEKPLLTPEVVPTAPVDPSADSFEDSTNYLPKVESFSAVKNEPSPVASQSLPSLTNGSHSTAVENTIAPFEPLVSPPGLKGAPYPNDEFSILSMDFKLS